MKRTFLLICLIPLSTGLTRCKKNGAEKEALVFSVKGTWELRSIEGGYRAPNSDNTYQPGNGNIWQFTDSSYKSFISGDLRDTGTYVIEKGVSPNTAAEAYKIVFDSNPDLTLFFEATNEHLIIDRGVTAADGVRERYVKIAELP